MFPEIILVALHLHIQLLDSSLLRFLLLWLRFHRLYFDTVGLFDVLALLDLIIHFFKLSLKPLLLLFFTSLLLSLTTIFSSRLFLLLTKRQIAKLPKNSNVIQLSTISN